jgi:hypothetical protein
MPRTPGACARAGTGMMQGMSFAVVHSRALDALEAQAVTVEVHLANGLPSFTLVGLADTEVKESRERVRAALVQSGFAFPHNKRITVNLAPADLPKESGRFDLPIALGILAAAGHVEAAALEPFEFAGRRIIRPARWSWSAAARRRGRGKFHWLMAACCSSTSCRSFRAPRWKRCASRWKAGTSPFRAPRARRHFRHASSSWRR